jgi:hypothetical protein
MAKRRKNRIKPAFFEMPAKKKFNKKEFVLEEVSFQELKEQKKRTQAFINYYWNYYSELALQREQIKDPIFEVLREKCISGYKFSNWQRAVKYKYSFHPLSCVGSMTFIGQRFNYGRDINGNLTAFPALYIAADKDTALQETLGQTNNNSEKRLSSQELALMNPQSETIVSVSGCLENVFDLRNSRGLTKFVNLVKNFKLSTSLKGQAKALNENTPNVVEKPKQLFDSIMVPDWRQQVTLYDVPSNSQIMGHILNEAGISGVLYNSKLTGKECIAIFTENFENTNSFIELDDDAPLEQIPGKLDSNNFKIALMTDKEILNLKTN